MNNLKNNLEIILKIAGTRVVYRRCYSTYLSDLYRQVSLTSEAVRTSAPTEFCQNLLVELQSNYNQTWAGTILTYSVILRLFVMFPIIFVQERVRRNLINLKPEVDEIISKASREASREISIARLKTPELLKSVRRKHKSKARSEIRKLYVTNNVHPAKMVILGLSQIPIWMFSTAAIRNFSLPYEDSSYGNNVIRSEFADGGFLWFPDLTQPDPLFIMPTIILISGLTATQIVKHPMSMQLSFSRRVLYGGFTLASFGVAAVMSQAPSALALFWASSSLMHVTQIYTTRRKDLPSNWLLGKYHNLLIPLSNAR